MEWYGKSLGENVGVRRSGGGRGHAKAGGEGFYRRGDGERGMEQMMSCLKGRE